MMLCIAFNSCDREPSGWKWSFKYDEWDQWHNCYYTYWHWHHSSLNLGLLPMLVARHCLLSAEPPHLYEVTKGHKLTHRPSFDSEEYPPYYCECTTVYSL